MMTDELDFQKLNKELDRTKTKVFLSKNAAFLGSLMCSLNFSWSEEIQTACTNGVFILWNPHFFLSLSSELRKTVLMHELWHVALLHMIRLNNRNGDLWNIACDYYINNMLDNEGYCMDDFPFYIDHSFDNMSVEEIYDYLYLQLPQITINPMCKDLKQPTKDGSDYHTVINSVVQAKAAASIDSSDAGSIPGEVETLLKQFLSPKLPWEQLLLQFFTALTDSDYSWSRPNRRYQDVYLPSLQPTEGLEHLAYYLDISGSVTNAQIIRFNSEVKYIKETFNPEKLSLILFDTIIQKEYEFSSDDQFEKLVVVGRGGTSLVPVRQHIIDNKPTAAIIFSDLWVEPMKTLPYDIPIIWVAINNLNATVNMGKIIHIRE